MKRILCVWLPNWPIQRVLHAQPEFDRRRPLVLYENQRGQQRVVACCDRAAAMGVRPGMPASEAAACDAAEPKQGKTVFLPYDPIADREALESLAERCGRFSPAVGREDSPAAESLFLDITGLAHLFRGETALAEGVFRDVCQQGFAAEVTVADTVGAAWAVAHFGSPARSAGALERSSNAARSAGALERSPRVVPPGETALALRPLPIEALRLPPGTIELLHELGIDRVAQVEALPRRELSSRLGPELLKRLDQAAGRLAEPAPVHRPPAAFQAEWLPDYPAPRREAVEAAMEHLLGEVAAELLEAGRGAVRLECCIRCMSGEPVGVSVGLFEPTVSAGHLFGALRMPFERLRLPGPVTAIRVAATATAPLEPRQGTLFAGEEPAGQPRDVALLVDRLIGRLGRHAVVGVRLVPDAQPEFGWHREVLASDSRRRRRKKPAAELPPRPIRLLPRPIALQASSSAPGDTEGGQSHFCGLLPQKPGQSPEHFPRQFRLNNRQHVVAGGWGPERIETGWWRGQTIGRDYYQVETTTGRRFWLFRRLRDGRWFLHGIFE